MTQGKLIITLCEDGSIKTDAREVQGSEKEIMELLSSLAKEVGGELTVEKHVHSHHAHYHDDHRHKTKG